MLPGQHGRRYCSIVSLIIVRKSASDALSIKICFPFFDVYKGTSKNPFCNAPVIAGMTRNLLKNEEMLKQEILKQVQDDVESF